MKQTFPQFDLRDEPGGLVESAHAEERSGAFQFRRMNRLMAPDVRAVPLDLEASYEQACDDLAIP